MCYNRSILKIDMVNTMNSLKLDRDFGLFNGMASSAYAEGVMRAEQFNQSCAIERKNQRINHLIDDIENLEDNYDLLLKRHEKLQAAYSDLQDTSNNDIDDYNALVDRFKEVVAENNKLRQENLILKENTHNLKIESSTQIERIQETSIKEQKAADAGFAILYRNVNSSRQNNEFLLKVVFAQNKFRSSFIESLIAMGMVSREMYETHLQQHVIQQDTIDKNRDGITYSESLSWVKVHNPSMYHKLC